MEVAKVLEIKTVAAYVDSQAVLRRLAELGVDHWQGFYP
ncbi:EAL domain-containing protein [Agrobacterium vitis]|nr:EAL domain-containing protein [Agrobacterium vitis]NSZ20055.1 EAL domain-containing protein [Agrobacterium vitis]QZO07492.1 EAL domain-containing protein [Agrobacterium vitis]UJL90686.1 EAL domain-containing protein [Agrobacterium vitis]